MEGNPLNLGQKIRETRKQRRLTLQRVSQATGLSIGFLSQVERNITRPSLTSLVAIARAYDVPVGTLLHQPNLPSAVSRRHGRVAYPVGNSRLSYERLSTTFPGQMLNAVKISVPARYSSDTVSYEGEAVIYVLEGTIRYVIDGTIYELQPGDSLHYSAQRPHRITNPTDRVAEVLTVGTQLLVDEPPNEGRDIWVANGNAHDGEAYDIARTGSIDFSETRGG